MQQKWFSLYRHGTGQQADQKAEVTEAKISLATQKTRNVMLARQNKVSKNIHQMLQKKKNSTQCVDDNTENMCKQAAFKYNFKIWPYLL